MAAPQNRTALKQLARQVAERRVQLNMHKIDVARAAGTTITTYSKIEAGEPVRDVTYGKIEPVLNWAPGTCRDILDGATGATTVERSPVNGYVYSPVTADDLQGDFEDSVQEALIAVADGLTAAEIRDIKQRAVEALQRRGRLPTPADN
ncbi:helix-turn-helix transcriptional regulator [Streptomyces sp. NPDC007100]|uniref:helix-turn-helix transcriptional regulator n=1 Tax=Streptomyces sp. NPDC007100 TaxID=3155602 RepID=UPI0033F6E4A9